MWLVRFIIIRGKSGKRDPGDEGLDLVGGTFEMKSLRRGALKA